MTKGNEMRSILRLITVLGALYVSAPKIVELIDKHVKRHCLEQITQKRTSLSKIARGLTSKKEKQQWTNKSIKQPKH